MSNDSQHQSSPTFPYLVAVGGFLAWLLLASLPWIALNCSWFKVDKAEDVDEVKSVLGQLGTFGDMFGALNCLFSGAAFVGVIYAIRLQRQELHEAQVSAGKTEQSMRLQNRLASYQNLAAHHNLREQTAGNDILLRHRSRGRVTAFAELMGVIRIESETGHPQDRIGELFVPIFREHRDSIAHVAFNYRNCRTDTMDATNPFGPVRDQLMLLVEQIAALAELALGNRDASALLHNAGTLVNRAVDPQNFVEPELDEQLIRHHQIEWADSAFNDAIQASNNLAPI